MPYSDGSWPALRNTEGVELRQNPDKAFAVRSSPGRPGQRRRSARKVLIQTAHQYQSGQLVYSRPKAYDLPEKPGRIYPTGTPLELILKAARRASFALLEPLVDPDKDCRLDKDDASDSDQDRGPWRQAAHPCSRARHSLDKKSRCTTPR